MHSSKQGFLFFFVLDIVLRVDHISFIHPTQHRQSIQTALLRTDRGGMFTWTRGDLCCILKCKHCIWSSKVSWESGISLCSLHKISLLILSYPPPPPYLHNCTSMNANLIFSPRASMPGNNFLSRQENIPEKSIFVCVCVCVCVWERERERECVVTKVWLWMCRQCAGMPLCQLGFVRACERERVWDFVVISTVWRAFARGIKTIGFRRCLYS